jgi:protein-L-isoaspartate(D-aspartate) O-methyltransferase
MALVQRETARGICFSMVYTSPHLRKQGYATSCVAALTQRMLDAGKRFCCLYTDLTNPTSNAIYKEDRLRTRLRLGRLGFRIESKIGMKNSNTSKQRGKTISRDLDLARAFYAEELRAIANLQSEAVVRAFAKVPREHFLGPGPWQVRNPVFDGYWTTNDADPRRLYHNLLVAIDASRRLNNGHPSFLAFLIDALDLQTGQHVVHVGCGTGYYTAIMAEVVGREGHVTAIEVDSDLASRAQSNLSYLSHVQVFAGDGGQLDPGPSDAIFVNAGATHPRSIWLDSLRSGARLLVPLTVTEDADHGGGGRVLKVTRQPGGFTASFISGVGIFSCVGGRDSKLNQRLKEAFERGDWKSVQSLRREPHEPVDSCWFHGRDFCLSKLPISETGD